MLFEVAAGLKALNGVTENFLSEDDPLSARDCGLWYPILRSSHEHSELRNTPGSVRWYLKKHEVSLLQV